MNAKVKGMCGICITILLILTVASVIADTTDEILFMDMKFGETTFNEAYKKLNKLGFYTVWWNQDTRLSTPITCFSHQEEMTNLGFPYQECKESGSATVTTIDCNKKNHDNKYKVGGYDVTKIRLEYSRYMYINGEMYYFDDSSDYRLYTGTFEFEYIGNSAAKEGKKTYDTLLTKLTKLYGEPEEFESKADWVKDKDVMGYHAIWKGKNNTGIILKCVPSISVDINHVHHDRRVVYLTYGRTDIYDLIINVNDILQQKNEREGL